MSHVKAELLLAVYRLSIFINIATQMERKFPKKISNDLEWILWEFKHNNFIELKISLKNENLLTFYN